jgi:hypothetical protein
MKKLTLHRYATWLSARSIPIVSFAVISIATLYPLWSGSGWPENHEANAFILRTQVYAEHLQRFDLLPIWSNKDNNGFGSAQPLLYHKLFYHLTGAAALLVDDIKTAVLLGIFTFLLIGALGMYSLMRLLVDDRRTCVIAGVTLVCAKYTVTNWLIRGALAEFAAAMLVPWVLMYYLRALQNAKLNFGLAITLALVFLCQSVICYYMLLILLAATVFLVIGKRIPAGFFSWRQCILLVFCFLGITGPYLIALLLIGGDYDMKRIITDYYQPSTHTQTLSRYFWDELWRFGKTPGGLSVQIDTPPLILMSIGAGALLLKTINYLSHSKMQLTSIEKQSSTDNSILALALIGGIAFFLQSRYAHYFYYHFPGAVFIQFPWRLLVLITPIAITLGLCLTDSLPRAHKDFIHGAYLAGMIILCGAFVPIDYGRFQIANAAPEILSFSWFGEFVPKRAPLPLYIKDNVSLAANRSGCILTSNLPVKEAEPVTFIARCSRQADISLPLFYSFAHRVVIADNYSHSSSIHCLEAVKYPGLCRVSLPKGMSYIKAIPPNIFTVMIRLIGL